MSRYHLELEEGGLYLPVLDVVVAINTVHHWPDVEAGLGECRRVLREDGTLAVAFSDHVRDAAGMDDDRLRGHLKRTGFTERRVVRDDVGTILVGRSASSEPQSEVTRSEP